MYQFIYFLISCLYLNIANAISSQDGEKQYALVLYDPELVPLNETDSTILTSETQQFLNYLKTNYDLTIADYNDEEVTLFYQDYLRFDNLILLPSSKKNIKSKSSLDQESLNKFINEGGNIFAVGGSSSTLPDGVRSFLNDIGIYPSPKNYKYIDHFNTKNNKIQLKEDNLVPGNRIIESLKSSEYSEGNSVLISNNELIQPIIKSSKTGYTNKVGDAIHSETTWTFGEEGYLAVGFQALNNARLVWIGSLDLLSDESLYKWCFQETGVIKLDFVQHSNANEPTKLNPQLYRIKDNALYTIGVSELIDGKWNPFEIKNQEDILQLSFKMLDPYQRLNLSPIGPVSSKENSSELDSFAYFVNFTVPDHHGMFTFELDYKRNGLSYISDKKVVTVRHLANDEFKRSWDISNSWLYIASTVIVILSWILFVVNYVYVI
ncbi:WBP1 [Candida pseudojiufengensis]|uniref:WBP1 n=1 Tax=Candida pseudojiufengensis TaxID=497109 RepID=UPI00222578BA|nr:WBP1 [Candida pseudojiufengensis]KAI5964865.1 WBP1 [Candida pseudojiufengensis]